MELIAQREYYGDKATIGDLYVNEAFECHTLEDKVRAPGVKIPGETAIPAGTYELRMTWSPRFMKMMPEIIGVPGFTGVRIHPGNTDTDTEGCILVGKTETPPDWIGQSDAEFTQLFAKLKAAWAAGERVTIAVRDREKTEQEKELVDEHQD